MYESSVKRDDLAKVGQTVTLAVPKDQKPAEWIDKHHPTRDLEGWTVCSVKVDAKGRLCQVFLERKGAFSLLCLSAWVTRDGTPVILYRGAV